MGTRFRALVTVCPLVLAAIVGLPADVAWAHGGGTPRLTNADVGPYWVSVWTHPDPLRVGKVHLTVAVSEPNTAGGARREAGAPVLDATVQVQFKPLDHTGETLIAEATHAGATNKILYEADLELPQIGRWQAEIAVTGPDGSGSALFEAQVSPPASFSWNWVGGLGVVALAAIWTIQKRLRRRGNSE